MACPYYQEPATGELIGSCNDNLAEIPSEVHQDCLCRSCSGTYVSFCPVYAKFERRKSGTDKWGTLRRIFLNGHRKPVYKDEPGKQVDYQLEPKGSVTQKEAATIEA